MKEISDETRWHRAQLIWLFYVVVTVTGSVIVFTFHLLPSDASLWFIVPLSMILCVSYFAKISAFVASYAFRFAIRLRYCRITEDKVVYLLCGLFYLLFYSMLYMTMALTQRLLCLSLLRFWRYS